MRRKPQIAAILLPFFIATLVNSSGADTALVALGIMLFTFRWTPATAPVHPKGQERRHDTCLFQEAQRPAEVQGAELASSKPLERTKRLEPSPLGEETVPANDP